jgi:hypothetical protein
MIRFCNLRYKRMLDVWNIHTYEKAPFPLIQMQNDYFL